MKSQNLKSKIQNLKFLQAGQPRAAAEFWPDFRARAAELEQDSREPVPNVLAWPRWAAAAAAVLLLSGLWLGWFIASGPAAPHGNQPVPAKIAEGTRIKSFEVFVAYDGSVIMDGDPDAGTILWVFGGEDEDDDI